MNILWIVVPERMGRYDDWLHTKFAEKMGDFENIYFYGKDIKHPKAPIKWSENISMDFLKGELKLDAVILDTINAAYGHYLPKVLGDAKNFPRLPSGFEECDIKKICIEEDFHYENDCLWHKEMGFKFILQKHYSQAIRKMELPFVYFPWSVDVDSFKYSPSDREGKIGFAGTTNSSNEVSNGSVYRYRESAITDLARGGLLAPQVGNSHHCVGEQYTNYLKGYLGYISCGSVFDLTPAKMWEIMASGGILFTNKVSGLEHIFYDNSYIVYSENASDVSEIAKSLIADKDRQTFIRERAIECIKRHHTNEIRVKQLLDIIRII